MEKTKNQKQKIKLLLVDDESGFLEQEEIFLKKENKSFDPETVNSGKKALKKLKNNKYDCVVSDYQMPGMDGLELLRKVRNQDMDIPFIIFTGKGREEVAIEALNLGADRYLQKRGAPKSQFKVLAEAIEQEYRHWKSERRIQKAKRRYKSLFESAPIVIWEEDFSKLKSYLDDLKNEVDDLRSYFEENPKVFDECLERIEVIDVNENALDFFDADSKKELIENFDYLFPSESKDVLMEEMLAVANNKTHFRAEEKNRTLNDDKKDVIFELRVPEEYKHDYSRVFISNVDITNRKDVERELKKNETKYRTIFETANDAIMIMDQEKFLDCNEKTLEIFECSKDQIIGRSPWELSPSKQPDGKKSKKKAKNYMRKAINGEPQSFVWKHSRPDGSQFQAEIKLNKYQIDNKKYIMSIVRDISERKQMEKDLKRNKKRIERFFNGIGDSVFIQSIGGEDHGKILDANDTATKQTGYSKSELIGMNIVTDLTSEETRNDQKKVIEKLRNGESVTVEDRIIRKDGSEFQGEARIVPIEYDNKETSISVIRDISERKNVKNKIQELHDVATKMETAKTEKEVCELAVSAAEEILEFEVCGIDLVEDEMFVPKAMSSNVGEDGFVSRSISEESIGSKTYKNNKSYLIDDLRKRKDGKPVKSEYRSVISVPIGDLGIFQAVSTKVGSYDQNDLEMTELLVSHVQEALNRVHTQKELQKEEELYYNLFNNNPDPQVYLDQEFNILSVNSRFEEIFGYKSDNIHGKNIDDILVPLDQSNEAQELNKKIKTDGFVRYETYRKDKNGNAIPVSITGNPIILDDEKHFIVTYKDIEQRKEAEEREEFLHSLLRHDVRNKIQLIQGYHEILEEYDLSEEAKEYLEKARKSVTDSMEILEKVSTLRKAQEEIFKEVKIVPIVEEAIKQVNDAAKDKGIQIECNELDKVTVKGGDLLKQVFTNILENSIQHSQGNTIKIQGKEKKGKYILNIEDDGIGIPDDKKFRIFDRNYTTDKEKGTGLGLYLVKTLIEEYNGNIEIMESDLGGAKFKISLKKA